MDDFLRKLHLSEYAIEIYLRSLGKFPRSYYELFAIVPKATQEEFEKSLKELIDAGLLVQLSINKLDSLKNYSVLPPILPILNYYDNIEANLPNIKNSIKELMLNSVSKIFHENEVIELDTILKTFHDIKKDIDEDSIIQKQEVEDIVEGMEELKNINEQISDLHQSIKSITQTKFADLIKIINTLKTDLLESVKKKEIINLVEDLFKEKFEDMVGDFTNNIHELIEKEFDDITKPVENTADLIFQYRNDFKMLLLNMLTNFETNMNKIYDLLRENHDNLSSAINKVENTIAENLNTILQNSISEISSLNNPIKNVMKNYLQEISTSERSQLNNLQIITSVTKINEAIQNIILNSKENITIIIPHIENHLAIEQFSAMASNLKIKIVSSEAHTNSIVKSFKNIKSIIYKSYQNDNFIILKSDNNQIFFGLIQESANPLYDFIGIKSTYKPLIEKLEPLITKIWENAYSDTFHAAQVTKPEMIKTTPTKPLTIIKPIIITKTQSEILEKPKKMEKEIIKPPVKVPSQIQEITRDDKRAFERSSTTPITISPKPQITDLKEKLKKKIEFVAISQPKADDEIGIEINNAFNNLIQKLNTLKGDEFGKELQNIADLILEKKGFSVTLHKIRSIINKFKEKFTLLNENNKREILENFDSWKKKLF